MKANRRSILTAGMGLGIAALPCGIVCAADAGRGKADEEGVTASEDLMREHGVLNRILLVYEEGLRRMDAQKDIPPEAFRRPASLVRKFVEDYHEKLEEKFIFPEFEKRSKLVDLVKTLRQQHEAGRRLTETILQASETGRFADGESRRKLVKACRAFIRMYRPHEAREDTVLFPALHEILSPGQIHELGESFEKEEDRLFGEGGFEKTVEQVAALEKNLGIYDLAQFTPEIPK
jgi:hemerythrin-like domain-containing protein